MSPFCTKCAGSGEIAIDARSCRYVAPGPVPEDAKNVASSTCFECLGTGQVIAPIHALTRDETNPFAPLDNAGWIDAPSPVSGESNMQNLHNAAAPPPQKGQSDD